MSSSKYPCRRGSSANSCPNPHDHDWATCSHTCLATTTPKTRNRYKNRDKVRREGVEEDYNCANPYRIVSSVVFPTGRFANRYDQAPIGTSRACRILHNTYPTRNGKGWGRRIQQVPIHETMGKESSSDTNSSPQRGFLHKVLNLTSKIRLRNMILTEEYCS